MKRIQPDWQVIDGQKNEAPTQLKRISFRTPDEILAMPRDEHANYMGDRMLAKGQSLVMAGIGGIGKSRLHLQQLAALITHRQWVGFHTYGEHRCLLIQTQNGTNRLQQDLEAVNRWLGKDWRLFNERIHIHTLETDDDLLLHLSDPENSRCLEAEIREYNPTISTFDPLDEVSVGNLNTDVDMSATCRELGRISRAGNPDRALVILHHALTGRAGVAKAVGLERTSFMRNSKVLHSWSRAVINVAPAKEDDYSTLVLICGKNSNGKEFPMVAVTLTDQMIYEVDEGFDLEAWREQITTTKAKAVQKFTVDMLRDFKFPESEGPALAKLIQQKVGCGRTRSYELIREGVKAKIFRFTKVTETYAQI